MLFRSSTLKKIKAGDVDRAFRRWTKLSVKKGTHLRTSIGVLEILDVKPIALKQITLSLAKKSGYKTADDLKTDLKSRPDGSFYQITFKLSGADPRLSLRTKTSFTAKEKAQLIEKLHLMDSRSRRDPWVLPILQIIKKNPGRRAADLAKSMGREKLKFKADVRKLKELGLTISLDVGYELSPRGLVVLKFLEQNRVN